MHRRIKNKNVFKKVLHFKKGCVILLMKAVQEKEGHYGKGHD